LFSHDGGERDGRGSQGFNIGKKQEFMKDWTEIALEQDETKSLVKIL
jgi:hypothetical protein